MNSFFIALISATWLGILTSISPCPLATNVVAATYIGKNAEHKKYIILSGVLYTAGRVLTYLVVAYIIISSLRAATSVSVFLQGQMNRILGPVLIISGMLLLGWLRVNAKRLGFGDRLRGRFDRYGVLSAFPLGSIFALSFCPVSAAIFFGSLIPLSIEQNSSILIPTLYGIGTALPVVAIAVIMAFAAHLVAKVFDGIARIEIWMRRITGAIFIIVGLYYSLIYIFGINL